VKNDLLCEAEKVIWFPSSLAQEVVCMSSQTVIPALPKQYLPYKAARIGIQLANFLFSFIVTVLDKRLVL